MYEDEHAGRLADNVHQEPDGERASGPPAQARRGGPVPHTDQGAQDLLTTLLAGRFDDPDPGSVGK